MNNNGQSTFKGSIVTKDVRTSDSESSIGCIKLPDTLCSFSETGKTLFEAPSSSREDNLWADKNIAGMARKGQTDSARRAETGTVKANTCGSEQRSAGAHKHFEQDAG